MLKKKLSCSFICVFMAVLMIALSVFSPVGAIDDTLSTEEVALNPSANNNDKIDSTLKEKMAEASPDEKIPVAIWLEDINKEELETKVEQTCGISKADVYAKQNDTILDTQLYQTIDSQNETLLRQYVDDKIEASKEQRAMKKLYNNTLRSVASELYAEHNESIVSATSIQEDDIIFLSTLTPFMLAEVEVAKIAELSANESIMSIGYYNNDEVSLPPSSESDENFSENMAAMNIDKAVERFGLTGDGVTVLMIDEDYVRNDHTNYNKVLYPENIRVIYNQNEYLTTDADEFPAKTDPENNHANHIVGALQSIASDAFIYSVKMHMYEDIEWAIENDNIDVINASINHSVDVYNKSYVAQWFDALIRNYAIAFVASAGNDYDHHSVGWPMVLSPSSGYNSISVGAYDSTTGKMKNYRYNQLNNPQYVNYKPELVAAAGDTSTGAAYVSGIVALMVEMDSFVASSPALIKAILMASCHEKALPFGDTEVQEDMYNGLTLKQGAGKVDAYKALSIVLMETYDTGHITSGNQRIKSLTFNDNNNVNVSLVWLRPNGFPYGLGPGTAQTPNTTLGAWHELTLSVENNNMNESSNVTNAGKQLVYFPVTLNSQYDVYVTKTTVSQTTVHYAYAWSTSFQKELTNAQMNGKFARNQQLSVTAQCNDETTAGVNTLNYQWQSSANGDTWSNISGATASTYTLTNQEFLKYVRCKVTPKDTSGILPYPVFATSDSMVIIYGDCNLNGSVTIQDATEIQKYVADLIDLSEDQLRASDVDGDGDVDSYDATVIRKYVASQISVFPVEQ